ncbi:hypothetical protein ABW20_dc0105875 [Dactylellina cionopaga]|nr:hypothetical protein ABW20_dc0105875 [Dactylellina cionopaga]
MKFLICLSLLSSLASAVPCGSATSPTITSVSSSTAAAASCSPTATLIDSVCDYTLPSDDFAFATDGPEFCWQSCWDHPVCNFVIFRRGFEGPDISGPGTCWLYPNHKYKPAKATKCNGSEPNLFVYNKPFKPRGSNIYMRPSCSIRKDVRVRECSGRFSISRWNEPTT